MRACVAAFVVLLCGCGGGAGGPEPERFQVSGEVKHEGKLVGDGMIYFEPTQGNSGAPGIAIIRGGKFDTAAEGGKGHVGGKMLVRMTPGAPSNTVILDDNVQPNVTSFPIWEEVQDFPKEDTTRNYEIPQDAEKLLEKQRVIDAA
jgi:hypothetical protein